MGNCRNCLKLSFGQCRLKTYRRTKVLWHSKGMLLSDLNSSTTANLLPLHCFPRLCNMNGMSASSTRRIRCLPSMVRPVLGMGSGAPSCMREKLSFLQSSLPVLWGGVAVCLRSRHHCND